MTKIPLDTSLKMFTIAGIDRDVLHTALREMAPLHLKGDLKRAWTNDNPTRNFCYVVAEWLMCYRAPEGSKAYSLNVDGENGVRHYFVRWGMERKLVDLTAEQFADWSVVNYDIARPARFMYPSPSKRAQVLNGLYGQCLAAR